MPPTRARPAGFLSFLPPLSLPSAATQPPPPPCPRPQPSCVSPTLCALAPTLRNAIPHFFVRPPHPHPRTDRGTAITFTLPTHVHPSPRSPLCLPALLAFVLHNPSPVPSPCYAPCMTFSRRRKGGACPFIQVAAAQAAHVCFILTDGYAPSYTQLLPLSCMHSLPLAQRSQHDVTSLRRTVGTFGEEWEQTRAGKHQGRGLASSACYAHSSHPTLGTISKPGNHVCTFTTCSSLWSCASQPSKAEACRYTQCLQAQKQVKGALLLSRWPACAGTAPKAGSAAAGSRALLFEDELVA